jgi:hypothetical protein
LHEKAGQIAKTLKNGLKVVLVVNANDFHVVSVDTANSTTHKESIKMATKKGAPATENKKPKAAPVEEEEELDLDLTAEEEEETGEELEEEEPEAGEELEAGAEEEEEAEPVKPAKKAKKAEEPAEKPAKAKKEKAPLNKAQQQFQDELDKRAGADKQKYSAVILKKLGLKIEAKGDERIDHMLRCMAIKKHLAGKK